MTETANRLTNEEAKKLYGEVPLRFSHYYKYTFTWEGIAPDGSEIYASFGGDSSDIYRYTVNAGEEKTLADFENVFNYVHIKKDGTEIFDYYDYC